MAKAVVKKFLDNGCVNVKLRFYYDDVQFLYFLAHVLDDDYSVNVNDSSNYIELSLGTYDRNHVMEINDDVSKIVNKIVNLYEEYMKIYMMCGEQEFEVRLE